VVRGDREGGGGGKHLGSSNSNEDLTARSEFLVLGQLARQASAHCPNGPDTSVLVRVNAGLLADLVDVIVTHPCTHHPSAFYTSQM
jgi:hypothetical protein